MTNSTTTLPAPRLQLRWAPAKPNKHKWNWACHYELVLPLREHDIRGEQGPSEDGTSRPNLTELVVPITSPTLRGSDRTPCRWPDGSRFGDAPYRDGAHARWDSKVLGGLPVYVIAPDGMSFLLAPPQAPSA